MVADERGKPIMPMPRPATIALLLASLIPAGVSAQQNQSDLGQAGTIASQPARDVGAVKTKIPPLLEEAGEAPYSMNGTGSCPAIANSVRALNSVLGPDFDEFTPAHGTRGGAIAKAGGTALVDSIIPFRGLVREVSGAAAADRRLLLAKFAGVARRGFLRGIYRTRGCRGAL